MLKIRLQRVGRRNQPHFRLVVVEHTVGPKSNDIVELVGFRNPKTKEQSIDADKVKAWIAKGAQPSDTVHNLLISAGILKGKKVNVLPKKTVPAKAEEATAA